MYNLKSNLTKMAGIGIVGLTGIVAGEAIDNEALQNISTYVLAGSAVGALIVGVRGMIDTERPYSQNTSRNNCETPRQGYSNQRREQRNQQVGGQENVQSYSNQRREQRNPQRLERDSSIREELYTKQYEIATDRVTRNGFGGWFWRRFYSMRDRIWRF